MMLKNKQIAFIGGGHITEIIVGNLIRTQTVSPDQIIVSDPDKDRLQTLCERHALGIAIDNIDAGVRCGIDRKTSTKVAYQTIIGSLEAWKRRQLSPSLLMEEASSPGGISVESLYTLDRYAFSAAIKEAIYNATRRAEELGASE